VGDVLVLGEGWVGAEVARGATVDHTVRSVDPPLVPELRDRDASATARLRRLVVETGSTMVVNACGLTRGSAADLEDANVAFPQWVCEVLAGTGARLVHIGSASEYGDPGGAEPVPETAPARPVGDYATTKARGTDAVLAARADGLDAVVARVFNLVGFPIPAASPVHQWLTELQALPPEGGDVEVWWPPTVRDFLTLPDAAAALVGLAGPGERPGLVNVCSGVGLAFGDIVRSLAATLGVRAGVRSLDRPGIAAVVGDPTLLSSVLGRVPDMSLERLSAAVLPDRTAPPTP
jgi:nucleoside-diphosphate-sugar epimerase